MSHAMLADLAILAKFCQIRQLSQNYAYDFNKCHPAMMADWLIWRFWQNFVKFVNSAKIMHMI